MTTTTQNGTHNLLARYRDCGTTMEYKMGIEVTAGGIALGVSL